ncbi:VasL domain-containing protein [Scandinavium goeteborgense]|uniref:VasL domain-containing protein n=1 Tax=Scandinavium goeteborgense TaxID=1851514 RepID=UPI000F681596|nr:VasL domain-containing protein [Scandinavium goeteborgense]QKN79828.1 type VI secretion system ImpA family N-terminal domain-containing protein [Scandinavium goeteborgense]
MHDQQPRPVRTGGDPRSLSEFMALRDEMSKLTHPARPDVNWPQVEALSLSLFEINGVELQTCAWYTLARTQLARVSGMNEGLTILTALLSHQWAQLWPQPANVRAEILNGLLQRLQKCFRTFSLTPADVPALALAEQRLQELKDILRRQALSHACEMNPLLQLIRSALSRLENSPHPEEATAGVPDPAFTLTEEATTPTSRLVYVIRKEPDVEVQVTEDVPVPPKRWPVFVAGMATALVLSAATVFGWQALHRPDDATQAMAASVAWIPEPMTPAQTEAFHGTKNYRTHSGMWLARMTNQVNWITTLAPGWRLRYGQGMVSQAKALWPDDPATRALVQRWEQYQSARTLPASDLNGWHDGMMQLRALSAQLDALDRQKGKYLTGSELKTIVWRITNTFGSAVPVEEQLRQLVAPAPEDTDAPQANTEQAARHLDSLIHVLEQLTVPGEQ